MKILECPPLGEERVKHIYESIDAWLRSSALSTLVTCFGAEIPSHLNTIELGTWLLHFSERWDFRKSQQEAIAKDTGEGSRWLVTDSSITESQHDIIEKSARELGLIGIEIPSKNSYDFLWVLGGARLSCLLRPRLAAYLVTKYALQCGTIALLASGRPISSTERNATDTYAPDAKTEFDLINRGAEIEFNIEPSFSEERNDDSTNINKSWIIRRYTKVDSLPSILSMSAPSSEPDTRRANSADTYNFFFNHAQVPPGSSLLLITSQIYVPYQQLEALRTVALRHNVIIETVGFPLEWSGNLQGMTGPSNYLQEIRSTIQSANRFFHAFPVT
ncbi:MAG TPA: hypothetical protein VKY19_08590 [Ktedonosporobacter sp.]|jgi:hypothetical protein|nr:hypothetical protein [Ktedonosporobacter sp.]